MNTEREKLDAALSSATSRTPLIIRGLVQAKQTSKPLPYRKAELAMAVDHARALLDELMLQQVRLGWRDRKGDAA